MPKPRTFKEEQAAFEASKRRQAKEKADRAAGKPVKTEGQKRTESAAGTRQEIIKATPGTSGLQALQRALAPKPKKNRKR